LRRNHPARRNSFPSCFESYNALILNQRLHPGSWKSLVAAARRGWVFCRSPTFDYTSREHVGEIAAWFGENSLEPFSLHAPMFPDREMGRAGAPAVNVLHLRSRAASTRWTRSSERLSPRTNSLQEPVVHLGENDDQWSPRSIEYGMTALEHSAPSHALLASSSWSRTS